MSTCTGQNGTYCCQQTTGHPGRHASTFRTLGVLKRATWADAYGPIRITRITR